MLETLGPGLLTGLTLRDWLRLLKHNQFRFDPVCAGKVAVISVLSAANSLMRTIEQRRYGPQIERTALKAPPLFILGHWRSGTTWLQELLALDRRFATPRASECRFPHSFLTFDRATALLINAVTANTRGVDRVRFASDAPAEDELALLQLTLLSPSLGTPFPACRPHYERYLTFEGVEPSEVERWQRALDWFCRKLTLRHGRPLLLKSPQHTARLPQLLELFPGARFVHIDRHPEKIMSSMQHLVRVVWKSDSLMWSHPSIQEPEEVLIPLLQCMYRSYFEHRRDAAVAEIAYTDLARDPVATLRRVYEVLELGGFERVEPLIRAKVEEDRGYQGNRLPPLSAQLRKRLETEWSDYYSAFGYDKAPE